MGYMLMDGAWRGPHGDVFVDDQLEEHHTRLTFEALRARCFALYGTAMRSK